MATLTTEQINTLWDNRFENKKCYNDSVTQDTSTFHCLRFASKLDGHNYYLQLETGVTHSSTLATIETKVKEAFATVEYIEPINESSVNMG